VGGLDLCDDLPSHSLFRTLDGVHHDDFHQHNFASADIAKRPRAGRGTRGMTTTTALRAPWRGTCSTPSRCRTTLRRGMCSCSAPSTAAPGSGSRTPYPRVPVDATRAGLVSGKDQIIYRSIQEIRTSTSTPSAVLGASSIKNQYFLGSSY
jgi:phospholipase D1/2